MPFSAPTVAPDGARPGWRGGRAFQRGTAPIDGVPRLRDRVSLLAVPQYPAPPPRPPATAWGTAIGMLARRDLSEGEVRERLLARDFATDEVEEAILRLHERRYLDDRSLARAVTRTQARTKHLGPLKVRAHLRRRRIPEELAADAIRDEFPQGAERDRAVVALRRLEASAAHPARRGRDDEAMAAESRKTAARLFRRLVSRGFSREAARQAVLSDPDSPSYPGDREIEA